MKGFVVVFTSLDSTAITDIELALNPLLANGVVVSIQQRMIPRSKMEISYFQRQQAFQQYLLHSPSEKCR